MNSIVLWFDLARRSFRSQSVYRINVLVNLIYSFMSVLINVSVWNALYAQNVDPAATLSEAITYSVISSTFLVGMQLWPGVRIGDAVGWPADGSSHEPARTACGNGIRRENV